MNTWEEVEQQPEFGVLSPEDKASLHKDWHENVLSSLADEDPEKVDSAGVSKFVATEKARNESFKTGQPFDEQTAQQAYAQQVKDRAGAQKQTLADFDALERAQFALKDAAANRGVTSSEDRGMIRNPQVEEILDKDREAAQKTLDEASSRFTPEQLQQAKEAKAALNGERPTAVLGSDLYTDPALVLDKDKYRAAVAESNASPEAKARAMADFTSKRKQVAEQALRVLRVAGESPLPGALDFPSWEATQPEDVRKLSPEDKALQYMRTMQGRGDFRKLTSAIGTGLLQGGIDTASQGLGVAAMVANSGELAKQAAEVSEGASTLEEESKLEGDKQATGATTAGGAARLLTPMAAAIAPAALTGGASLPVAAGLSGLQTAGAQFPNTYKALIDQGVPEEQALTASRNAAITSGLITTALTAAFGKTGAEAALLTGAGGKELVKSRLLATLKGAAKGSAAEIPEELLDEAASQVIEQRTIDPNKPVSQIVDEFAQTAPDLVMQIALLGGVGGGVGGYRDSTTTPGGAPTVPVPGTTAATPQQPETLLGETPAPAEGLPVQVEGVTIAHIPEWSPLTPEDVAEFAAEPDTMKMMARLGLITLPEIVTPLPGVDPAIAEAMNENIATSAALAPQTVEALKAVEAEGAARNAEVLREAAARLAGTEKGPDLGFPKQGAPTDVQILAWARENNHPSVADYDAAGYAETMAVVNREEKNALADMRKAYDAAQVSPVTTETETPSNAANVAGGSQSVQTEPAEGSIPAVTGDTISTSDIASTAEIQPTQADESAIAQPDEGLRDEPAAATEGARAGEQGQAATVIADPVQGEQPQVTNNVVVLNPAELEVIPEDLARAKENQKEGNERWQQAAASAEPISVLQLPDGRYRILDGHHRALNAIAKGEQIQAIVEKPWAPAINEPATFTAVNGQKVVGTVSHIAPNGKATVNFIWNGKDTSVSVPTSQLSRPITSLADGPKYVMTQEQNTRKAGKHFPTTPGVHENFDFNKAFASMAEDTSLSKTYREVARLLSKLPGFSNVDLHVVADGRKRYAGEYSHHNGKSAIAVNLRQVARGNVDALGTILHEALHHLTMAKVHNPQGDVELDAVAAIHQLRQKAEKFAKTNGQFDKFWYEFSNNDEFITGLFTRQDFQEFLASVPDSNVAGKFRSILSEVFRRIAELLTGKHVPAGSTLEQSIASILALFETPHRGFETGALEKLSAVRSKPDESALDAEYMAAVESGDVAKQQAMVDAAAKAAGYGGEEILSHEEKRQWEGKKQSLQSQINIASKNIESASAALSNPAIQGALRKVAESSLIRNSRNKNKLSDEIASGPDPIILFHGRSSKWSEYRRNVTGRSIWATNDINVAKTYGPDAASLYMSMHNPLEIDAKGASFRQLEFEGVRLDADDLSTIAEERGHDGIIIRDFLDSNDDSGGDIVSDHYSVFSPNQIKSADPITRDAEGNVIPLSQRFNDQSNDTRFSLAEAPTVQTAVMFDGKPLVAANGVTHYDLLKNWIKKNLLQPYQRENADEANTLADQLLTNAFLREHKVQEGFMVNGEFANRQEALQAILYAAPINPFQSNEPDAEARGSERVASTSPELDARREEAISAAVAQNDWGNYTREQKVEAAESFLAERASSLHSLEFPPNVRFRVAVGDGSGANVTVSESPSQVLDVTLNVGQDQVIDKYANLSPQEVFAHLYDTAQEEIIHVAHYLGMHRGWMEAREKGFKGTFLSYLGQHLKATFDQVNKARVDLRQSDPAAAQKIEKAMLASWNIYYFNDKVEDIEGLRRRLEGNPSAQGNFILEMVRQLTQLKRQDFTTENGWQKFQRMIKQWITDAINSLRGVQDLFRSGMAGDLIQKQLADLEAALGGKPLPPAPTVESTPKSMVEEEGPRTYDVGGEAEPATGEGKQLYQKKPTAIGSTYTTPADITLQEKRAQEETLAAARTIIGESVAADGPIKGRRAALDRFRLDTNLPPEVRAAGTGLIAQQADILANLEEGDQQLLLDEMTDEAAKLSGVIASDPDSFKNLKADANLNIDKMAEEAGRTLNIFNVFRRLTPEGFLRRMTRKYNEDVRERVSQNFDVPVEKVESEIALLRRLARESTSPERRKAILAAIKAYQQHDIDAKKIIESLFPQAGFRERMSKGGEALVRNFFQMMTGPRAGKGPLTEFDESIQGALSSMLRKVMEAQGLVAKNESAQMTDIDKMVRSVSGDELRFDKIAAADEAMQKELAGIQDPERRAVLQQAWEEATSKMYTNIASDATVRRAINSELKDLKVDWTQMFDSNQKPAAIRAKVVDAVMGKIEALLTDPTSPTVQRNLDMLRDEVGAAFDFIADNKHAQWLAQREAVEARRRVAEHRAAFMEALRNQGVAEQAINRISEKLAGPQRGKPDQNPVSALVGEHMKQEVADFVDKLVALDVDRATAEKLDAATSKLRTEIAAAEKLKAADRAVKELMKSLKPKPRAPREKIEKSLKALFTADTVGALDDQAFFDAFGEAFGMPPLSSEQQTRIKKLIREINSMPKGPARLDKQQDLDEELALWKGIAARDVLLSAWYSNILSGVSTQGMGILGNLLNFVPRSLFNAIANPRSAGAYFKGALGEGLSTGLEEAKAALKGRGLYKVSKYGDKNIVSALELLRKKGPSTLPEWVAYIASAGTRLRYVFRIMQAIDALAWNTAREGHAYLAAHRALLEQEKETGQKRSPEEFYKAFIDSLGGDTAQIEEDLREARQKLIDAGQTPDLLTVDRMAREARNTRRAAAGTKGANRFADRIVLQQEPEGSGKFISSLIEVFQKKGEILGLPLGQMLVPFNKIVSNLFEQSLDYTPVGALRAYLGGHLSDIKPGSILNGRVEFKDKAQLFDPMERRERAMAATAGMAATAIMYALANAFKDDPDEDVPFMVYGWGPESKNKRTQMPKGWVPYSIKIGDQYFKFSEMPFGMMFAAAGSAMDAMRYKNMDKKTSTQRLAYILKTAAKGFMNQGVMSSLDTAMETMMFDTSEKKMLDIPANALKGFVPAQGMLRDISNIMDLNKVTSDSLTSALLRDMPFAKGYATKPDLNVFGEPVKMDGYPIIRRIITHREPHTVADYLGRNDLIIPGMEPTIEIGKYLPDAMKDRIQRRAVELGAMENGLFTPEQNYEFKKRAGQLTKVAVESIMDKTPTITNEKQREHVQSLINKRVEIARRKAMLEAVPAR